MRGDNALINAAVSYFKLSNRGCLFLGVKMNEKEQFSHGAVPPSGSIGPRKMRKGETSLKSWASNCWMRGYKALDCLF